MGWFDRYFVPVLPCLAAAAAAALAGADRAAASLAPRRALVAVIGVFLLVWQLANPAANPLRLLARSRGYPRAVAARNAPCAQYLQDRFGDRGSVVAGDVGFLGYHFHGAVWDLYGLASYDRTLRHGGALEPYLRELLARSPDAVVLCFTTDRQQGRGAADAPQVSRSEPKASEGHRTGEAERSVGPREDEAEPCLHAERVLAAMPEFRERYSAAAEFGRAEVPSDYHVVFTRAHAGEPAP
jgi:hypothetical protein